MTELELLMSIEAKLTAIYALVQLFLYTYLLFAFITWVRRIISKWRKGQGINE